MEPRCLFFLITLATLLAPFELCATEQIPDVIIYNGKQYSSPFFLWSYFQREADGEGRSMAPEKWAWIYQEAQMNTALWRGHIATYEIVDNELVLKDIIQYRDNVRGRSAINILDRFLSTAGVTGSAFKIDWFTGSFVLDGGQRIHRSIIHEYHVRLEFENGMLIQETRMNSIEYVHFLKERLKREMEELSNLPDLTLAGRSTRSFEWELENLKWKLENLEETEEMLNWEPPPPGNRSQFNPAVKYSFFTDPRDGQMYRTVRIGNFRWMAENLNFETGNSWCCYYRSNNSPFGSFTWMVENLIFENDNCNSDSPCEQRYGRLYDWNTAMEACPPGWRLPSCEEWDDLANHSGGERVAGRALKSNTGWGNSDTTFWGGTNDYGWSAMPGGRRVNTGAFYDGGKSGYWWTSTTTTADENKAHSREIDAFFHRGLTDHRQRKQYGYSIRCIRD